MYEEEDAEDQVTSVMSHALPSSDFPGLDCFDLDDVDDLLEYQRCTEDYCWTEWNDDDVVATFYATEKYEIKVEILKQSL